MHLASCRLTSTRMIPKASTRFRAATIEIMPSIPRHNPLCLEATACLLCRRLSLPSLLPDPTMVVLRLAHRRIWHMVPIRSLRRTVEEDMSWHVRDQATPCLDTIQCRMLLRRTCNTLRCQPCRRCRSCNLWAMRLPHFLLSIIYRKSRLVIFREDLRYQLCSKDQVRCILTYLRTATRQLYHKSPRREYRMHPYGIRG